MDSYRFGSHRSEPFDRLSLEAAAEMASRVQRLIALRERLGNRMDSVYVATGYNYEHPAFLHLRNRYVRVLSALAGLMPEADCWIIDPDLASMYSDCYKGDYGIRPRGFCSYEDVQAFFARRAEESSRHEDGTCGSMCLHCLDSWWSEECRLMDEVREDALAAAQAALADEGPDCLDVPVQCGRGCREVHRFKEIYSGRRKAGVGSSLRALENRGKRNRIRSTISQALKFQEFDLVA